jgi:hypothetical protein
MKLTLYTHKFKNPQDEYVHVFTLIEDITKDILFQSYLKPTKNEIITCIKQLEPIKHDTLQLFKDLYNHHIHYSEHTIDWKKHIQPLIKNNNCRIIL